MGEKKAYPFPGNSIDVTWDGRLCIHIGECGQASGDLFVSGRQPWCVPDLVAEEYVAEVCERCPSGALTYAYNDAEIEEQAASENTVRVVYNGPYYIRGNLAIEGAADDMPGVKYRAALCRCGQSGNKPFCDNSHEKAGFRDYAAVGEQGEAIETPGGVLTIKPLQDGPLLLSGHVTIEAGSGRAAWRGDSVALCRCGASNHKPFCDGSHKQSGFKSAAS